MQFAGIDGGSSRISHSRITTYLASELQRPERRLGHRLCERLHRLTGVIRLLWSRKMRCKAFTDGAHVQLCSSIMRARGSARRTGVGRSKVRAKAALSAPASHEINTVSDTRKKISMVQLGCPKNTVDGERFTFSACVTDTDVALLVLCTCKQAMQTR